MHGATNGLLYNANDEKRTVYSLRHTYATYALKERELNMEDLALNMGTSVAMIEQHYRQLLSSQIRERLVGEPNAPDPDHWDPADDPENA